MPHWIPLMAVDGVPAETSARVQVDGRCYLVCRDGGRFHVTDCVCPHAGGPLGGAEIRNGCMICPVHRWPWNLQTGLSHPRVPGLRLHVYPCEVRDGTVWADISTLPGDANTDLDLRNLPRN